MTNEDELKFGADHHILKLLQKKTTLDSFWSGLKISLTFLALFLSIYSVSVCNSTRATVGTTNEFAQLKLKILANEEREKQQLKLIKSINETFGLYKKSHGPGKKYGGLPVMFDCYRTNRLSNPSVVTYDGCFVDTTDGQMNINTGEYKVLVEGVYQISFSAKYVSSSRGRFGAWSDIFVNETVIADSQREYNGRNSLESETSTHTILAYFPLRVSHILKVQFNKDGTSYIHSDEDHDVHFTARRVGPIPP